MEAQAAVDGIRSLGRERVVTFLGFSDAGYEDEAKVRETLLAELRNFDPLDTIVCCGATAEGIGMVYPLAVLKGFQTAGIVSSLVQTEGGQISKDCGTVFVVDDNTWGGKQINGSLSSTSQAVVSASDVMIGIGGGAITRDELEEGLKKGKIVRFHKADMNHLHATGNAAKAGKLPPREFGGDAQALFHDQSREGET
ncbi:hypothetical protein [Pseudomonas fluorescens]|uniref:Uncharacterized protein n=1 Tax=Pseudomonas fluorescens TaxID=294 RepID=A0A5E7VUK3_PSEFL|nr:hypothetical protein [Pseudomonas fluorescens]VVQ26362.1 hypothetical protein PS928_06524 [Pseudomonas fluorescens]